MPFILSEFPFTKLVVLGKGEDYDDLIQLTQRLGIERQVKFRSEFVSEEERILHYAMADVCVVSSLYEPFGIVALEAMAAGTPVVATGVGGLLEIVEHDRTGVVVYPNNPDSLAWGITRVLTDGGYADLLRLNALRKVSEVYDWKNIAKSTLGLYERVLREYEKGSWKPSLLGLV